MRPLRAREVTLAACSTGVRPESAGGVRLLGDDVIGLPASFLEAGAASVLVSVTPVGDREAASFFHAYHAARLNDIAPLDAFNVAQRNRLLTTAGRFDGGFVNLLRVRMMSGWGSASSATAASSIRHASGSDCLPFDAQGRWLARSCEGPIFSTCPPLRGG